MMSFVPWSPARATGDPADTAALLARVAAGDRRALERLYRREADPVYRYALALCGNAAWAADATQDAFIALATRPQGFDAAQGTLGGYLAGIARNSLRAQWRRALGEEPLPEVDGDAADAGAESPEGLLVRAQDTQALWRALRQLPAPFREALVLVDLQERPYAEAARVAGIEINTLRTRLHRGRQRLATLLNTRAGEDT